jgi:hypothetical protein
MASAPTEILSKVFLLLGPLNSYGQLSLVNKHWREALQVCQLRTCKKHDLLAVLIRHKHALQVLHHHDNVLHADLACYPTLSPTEQMPELWRDLSYKGSNRSQECK